VQLGECVGGFDGREHSADSTDSFQLNAILTFEVFETDWLDL